MALARLPKPRFADVLGGGNQQYVKDTTLRQLQDVRGGWVKRQATLKAQQEMDRRWLSTGALAQSSTLVSLAQGSAPPTVGLPLGPGEALRGSVLGARLGLADAELAQLDAALAAVDRAIAYVSEGGLSDSQALPRKVVAVDDFKDLRVTDLPQFGLVEGLGIRPKPTASVLLELAQMFEQPDAGGPLRIPTSGGVTKLDCFPAEVGYGLLLLDRSLRIETQSEGRPDTEVLLELLDEMLARPADFDAASNDLGYLAFMRWYAAQGEGGAAPAVAEEEAEAP
jgi:hypothetical protein